MDCKKTVAKKKGKLKNPKGRYIIHSSHKKLPKEQLEMGYISFDPGEVNFTVRLEKRCKNEHGKHCKSISTITQSKHKVTFQREFLRKGAESGGKSGTRCFSTSELIDVLDSYSEHYPQINIALVEGQMAINFNMMHMQSVIISYFLIKQPHIVVVEVSSKLKGTNLGATDLSRQQLKKWGIEKAMYLANERDDKYFIDYINKQRKAKKSEQKIDDDTDNYIQIEAFCVEAGYQLTKTTKAKNTYKGPSRLVPVTSSKKVTRRTTTTKVVKTVKKTKTQTSKFEKNDSSSSSQSIGDDSSNEIEDDSSDEIENSF